MKGLAGRRDRHVRYRKLFIHAALVYICAVCVAVGLMWLIRAIPFQNAYRHIGQEAQVMVREPLIPQVMDRYLASDALWRDNITDATMMSIMMPDPTRSAFQSALANAQVAVRSGTPAQALVQQTQGGSVFHEPYARYWHGYQLLYLPLLEVFSYNGVRVFMALVLTLQVLAILLLLSKRVGWRIALIFGLSLLATYSFMAPFSLQFVAVFLIGFAFTIVVLAKKTFSRSSLLLMFFLAGILTVFFDFLTAPFITCGIPLLCYLAIRFHEEPEHFGRRRTYETVLGCSLFWLLGYGLFWAAKWIVASMFLPGNVMSEALGAVAERTGYTSASSWLLPFQALARACTVLVPRQLGVGVVARALVLAGFIILAILVWLVLYLRRRREGSASVRAALPFFLVATFPFVWLSVLAEHTMVHYSFVYRVLVVSVFAVLLFAFFSLKGAPEA